MHVAEDAPQTNAVYDAAERYVRLGISVIPIQPGTKEPPVGFRWGEYATRIADASERYEWFVVQGYQIAVVSGPVSGWLVPLDFDGPGGYTALAERFPRVCALPRLRTGSGKTHVWLRVPKPTKKYVAHAPDGSNLEVRAGTHYTLVPPSIHPSGEPYVWERMPDDGIPVLALESIGLHTFEPREREPGEPVDEGDSLSERDRQHILELVTPHYVPYARHELCLALSGWLASNGVPESDARWIVDELAATAGDATRVREYRRGVRDTYAKTRQGISVAGWARLTSSDDPLVSPSTAKQLDLLLRYRNPVLTFGKRDDTPSRDRFSLIPIQEMKSRKPPPPLVSGLLSCGALAGLVGDSGTYKSFLAVDLAIHIGVGLAWFGHAVESGLVVYVSAEGQAGMGSRIKAWEIAHETAADNVWFITEAPSIPDRVDVEGLLTRFKDLPDHPRLIVLDTLARTMVGMDENSTPDMGLYVAGADRLRFATGAVVFIVHHENKQGGYRGSTAFKAGLDTMFQVKRDADDKRLITLSTDKQKDLDLMEPLQLRADVVDITPGDGIFPGIQSVVLEPADAEPRVRKTLTDEGIVAALVRMPGWWGAVDVAAEIGFSDKSVRPRLAAIAARRLIVQRTGRSGKLMYAALGTAPDAPDF